jgi:hypothetical protein
VSAILDLAAGNAMLKEWYDGQKVQNLVYAKNPFLALLPKDESNGGKYYPVPLQYEVNQGRSATFSNAQGNQTANAYAEFLVTRKRDYDIATIDNETLEASMSDKGAFLRLGTSLVDSAIRGGTLSAASSAFRTGTGTIGRVSSTVAISTGVITLSNAADVVQFGVNQTLQANATDGGTPRAALGYVIARSISAGTITVSATTWGGAADTPSGWTTSDFLLVQGDNNLKFSGLAAWLPMTDPTSTDNFYGVNRSTDPRLYGIQYNGSGQPIEEAVIDHSMLLAREGSMPDLFVTNFGSMSSLTKALGTRREYEMMEGPAGIGFRTIVIDGANGRIRCLADRNCQVRTGYLLQLDTWKLISIGPVPKVLRYEDRFELLRVYNQDSAECRVGLYANLCCNAPGWNGQNQLAS